MALPAPGTVELWRATTHPELVEKLVGFLDENERSKAERFHREPDRRRFIVARGSLRHLLGNYLDADPLAIKLVPGEFGKLGIAAPVQFSVTHSDEYIGLAFSAGLRIGLDVQRILEESDVPRFAARCLTPRELNGILRLPAADRTRAFYAIWTLKEAFLKGTGYGLTRPMREIEVATSDAGVELSWVGWDGSAPSRWRLCPLTCDPGFAAALAIEIEGQIEPPAAGYIWKDIGTFQSRF